MKVLFAVGNAVLSEKIASTYFSAYGEKIEYKDVFYFKAILEEVKRDKSYDRIVIAEQLEPMPNNVIDEIDKMLFNNIDSITDEIEDSTIIFICSDNRNKNDQLIGRLFNLGIYNVLMGDERQVNFLCKLIKEPRSKKEAKDYLRSNPAVGDSTVQQDDGVNETELINIIRYFEGLKSPEEYLSSFASVAEQYNDDDLIVIVAALTKQLKKGKDIFNTLKSDSRYSKYCEWNKEDENPFTENKKGEKKGIFGFLKNKNNNNSNSKSLKDAIKNHRASEEEEVNPINDYKGDVGETIGAIVGGGIAASSQDKVLQEQLKAQQEAQRIFEEENKLKAEQEELLRKQQEEEKRIRDEKFKAQQEAYLRAQQEAQIKAQREELLRQQQEAQLKAQQEELLRQQQEAQLKAQQEELLRKQQEAQLKAQQEELLRKQQEAQLKAQQEELLRQQQEAQIKAQQEELLRKRQEELLKQQEEARIKAEQEALIKKQQEELMKKQQEEAKIKAEQEAQLKAQQEELLRQQEAQLKAQQEALLKEQEAKLKAEQEAKLKAQQEELFKQQKEAQLKAEQEAKQRAEQEEIIRKQREEQFKAQQDALIKQQEEARLKVEQQQSEFARQQEQLRAQQEELRKQKEALEKQAAVAANTIVGYSGSSISYEGSTQNQEDNGDFIQSIGPVIEVPPDYKKVVAFIGTNKVGTTFVANCVATLLSAKGVKTSLLDMTKNRGLFWFYSEDTSRYLDEVSSCMSNLSTGTSNPIQIGRNKNLTLYTTVPKGKEDNRKGYKHKTVIETAKKNCNMLIIDCDFTTPVEYLEQAQEIYVVQDLDLLKLRETQEFFRDLKARHTDWSKLRVVVNNVVQCKMTPKEIIKSGLTYYSDTTNTYTEEFERISRYIEIPMELQNYTTYLDAMNRR